MAKALVDLVKQKFPADVLETHSQRGDETVVVYAARWKDIARFLRDEPRADMSMLVDLTAVDFPDRSPRFEVVAHFYSLSKGHRLRLKARVGDTDGGNAEIDTLSDLWASANWAERECWDMFGVRFAGHPDLRRILLYPEFEGHPLRKDYPAERIQPLVPYREVPDIDKIPPFRSDEGMSFGRQTHAQRPSDDDDLN
ncbi:MAG TPA: NADH-quinone oxidoreductase subunit C [Polyangiaceae bacterium]|nr:NADH-quinone oxidoreductase subunit C [Polyangiaceae bacterium]